MTRRTDLSAAQARRIALAAQGFTDRAPSGAPTRAHLRRVIGRTKLLQMDSVNIAVRAHYMPLFSRLGAYDRGLLDRAAWSTRGDRMFVEYWAHEAALIPIEDWPLFGWRRDEFRDGRYRYTREVMQRNRALARDVQEVIASDGPSTPRQIEERLGIEREPGRAGSWWQRGEVKHVCEALFAAGDLSATRNGNFVRHYALTESIVGADNAGLRIERTDAHRQLAARAAHALGVATVTDIADYYRTKTADARAAVADLVDDGTLLPVRIGDRSEEAYLHTDAVVPRTVARSALLSPFDPLVFHRPRAERLFDFHYRIEIYVPAHKRVHGYYVLPYLMGDEVVARVDVKADRKASVLHVPAAYLEENCDDTAVAARLAIDLRTMATWLGLENVEVGDRGSLAPALSRSIGVGRPTV